MIVKFQMKNEDHTHQEFICTFMNGYPFLGLDSNNNFTEFFIHGELDSPMRNLLLQSEDLLQG